MRITLLTLFFSSSLYALIDPRPTTPPTIERLGETLIVGETFERIPNGTGFEKPRENEPITQEYHRYYDHQDIYTEVLDWEAETGLTIDQNIRICIEDDCELFWHKEEDNYAYSTIDLARTKKKPGGTSGVKQVLKAIGSGVSAGGKVKIGKIRINVDGSMELNNVEISGGIGLGTDAPVPGYEDGKQVHKK